MRFNSGLPLLLALAAFGLAGCSNVNGNSASAGSSSSGTITIAQQPASQQIALGQTATFRITASSSLALSYQWTRNGTAIAGATASTYTTPAIVASDNGAQFAVTVSDATTSVASSAATLTATPRAPVQGDLRLLLFQQATSSGFGNDPQTSDVSTYSAVLFPGAIGSPLSLGSAGVCTPGVLYKCGWQFFVEYLPTPQNGLNMQYQSRSYQDFESDLNWIIAPNVVITSLDLEPANDAYAIAWVFANKLSGFDFRRDVVCAADFDATVAQAAAQGRVVTAVSFDASGQANIISYGWNSDHSTIFESRTIHTTLDQLVDSAKTLAAAGYVISAFGGNDANGYLLVGTRVQGDTLPRTLSITTASSTLNTAAVPSNLNGTPVAHFFSGGKETLISEY